MHDFVEALSSLQALRQPNQSFVRGRVERTGLLHKWDRQKETSGAHFASQGGTCTVYPAYGGGATRACPHLHLHRGHARFFFCSCHILHWRTAPSPSSAPVHASLALLAMCTLHTHAYVGPVYIHTLPAFNQQREELYGVCRQHSVFRAVLRGKPTMTDLLSISYAACPPNLHHTQPLQRSRTRTCSKS
jgi:hypothetical protein